MIPAYVGYDEREDEAYRVCASSLREQASVPVQITRIGATGARQAGLFDRPVYYEDSQPIDGSDGKPFSTDFAFARFLIPALMLYQGWALFCDCDFLFLADIAKLWSLRDERYAVMVVKHQYMPAESVKMDGMAQGVYARKNWSSLVLWNCEHPANTRLSAFEVNRRTGSWLHGFQWLDDEQIGELPLSWNWLSGVSPSLGKRPDAVHFTLGGPWFENHRHHPYSHLWLEHARRLQPSTIAA